jgi:hypothetical protein
LRTITTDDATPDATASLGAETIDSFQTSALSAPAL